MLTSSLFVSVELCNNKNVEVIQLGGQVRKSSNSVTGNIAESVLKNFSCNTLFLGVDGIDVDFGITTTNFSEASLNKAMIAAAEKVIVLTDSSKIGKRSFSKIGDILDVHILITDDAISHKHKKELENIGIKVMIA